jgi:hypothetical protein
MLSCDQRIKIRSGQGTCLLERTSIYYFEVAAEPGQPQRYVAEDGTLVDADTNLWKLRTFASASQAHKFFEMMNGRYAGLSLMLRCRRRGD